MLQPAVSVPPEPVGRPRSPTFDSSERPGRTTRARLHCGRAWRRGEIERSTEMVERHGYGSSLKRSTPGAFGYLFLSQALLRSGAANATGGRSGSPVLRAPANSA